MKRLRVADRSSDLVGMNPGRPEVTLDVGWAGQVDLITNVENERNALGKPDGLVSGLTAMDSTARYSGFTLVINYDPGRFADLLGVSKQSMAEADFIAFEYNGSPDTRFESSTWVFTDGDQTITVRHDFNNPQATKYTAHSGNLNPVKYAKFFGATPLMTGCYAFLLFEIDPVINTNSARFSVTLSGSGNIDTGTPNPDALGVIRFHRTD